MPRTRVSERTRWEQLANAVIELGQNMRTLEARLAVAIDKIDKLEHPESMADRLNREVREDPVFIEAVNVQS